MSSRIYTHTLKVTHTHTLTHTLRTTRKCRTEAFKQTGYAVSSFWANTGFSVAGTVEQYLQVRPVEDDDDDDVDEVEVKTKHLLCKAFDVVLGAGLSAGCSQTTCQ